MARYDEARVPRGTSRRWEVLLAADAPRPPAGSVRTRSALEVRAEHRVLRGFSDADLRRIPVLPEGTTLSRRARYLDLHDPARAEFPAEGYEVVEPGQHVIAEAQVARELWDRLRSACEGVVGRAPHQLRRAV